jgi:hypothetical protein
MVLAKVTYNCEECGLEYRFIIDIDNNELNERLETLKQKCSKCKSTVDAQVEHIKPPYLTIDKNIIYLFGTQVIAMNGDEFNFNLANLAEAGFCGNVNLHGYDNVAVVGINSIYKKVDKFNSFKKPLTKVVRYNRPVPTMRTETIPIRPTMPTINREERAGIDNTFERQFRDMLDTDTDTTTTLRTGRRPR